MRKKLVGILMFTCVGCMLVVSGIAQEKKEIRCYWMGSSSCPMRLVKTFDDFVNAGKCFSTKGSVRGDTVRLDRLASGDEGAKEIKFSKFNKGDFDYVIVQISMGFVRDQKAVDGMGAVVGDLCKRARELDAEPVLWEAYAATPDKATGQDTVQMQARLHAELIKVAVQNNALFVPAGSPWQEVRMGKSDDRPYMFSAIAPSDSGHTGPRGNFILGAAIYAAVTGENPVKNPNLNTYEMTPYPDGKKGDWASAVPFPIDAKEAAQFKEVVWKHELKAREEYKALGGKFVHPARVASGAAPLPVSTATTSSQAVPQGLEIYLIMGTQAVIAPTDASKGAAPSVFVFDSPSSEWKPHSEKCGDGGIGSVLASKSGGKPVGLIFCGVDGSTMEEWSKGKKCYNKAMTLAQDSLRQGTLKACVWLSATGEADVKSPIYSKMVTDFREEVPSADLPFITQREAGLKK